MAEASQFNYQKLSKWILGALGLGFIVGLILNATVADIGWVRDYAIDGLLGTVGQMFVQLLSMLIVPIVFVSLVAGVASLADPKALGRVGGKGVGLYLITTAIAVTLALSAGVIFKPGQNAQPPEGVETPQIDEAPPFSEVLIDMVPDNPIAVMAAGNMLPLIVFSILLGLAISLAGRSGEKIGDLFAAAMDVVMKLVTLVMLIAPIGVFALITEMAATTGWDAFLGLLGYVILVLVMLILHATVVYPSLLRVFTGLSPVTFFRKIRDVQAFAFSTASSGATIPVTLRAVEKRLGASNRVTSFVVPLGATVNMDGTAIMQGIAVAFIAQYYGVDLTLTQYAMVVFMVIMASIGTAGVPGVGLIILAGVLGQVGLPAEGIALILGVDRLLDMTRTAVNVTGDAAITTIVAHSENELDLDLYNNQALGIETEPQAEAGDDPPKPREEQPASDDTPTAQR